MAYVFCSESLAVTGPSPSQPWSVKCPRAGFISATRRVWRLMMGGICQAMSAANAAFMRTARSELLMPRGRPRLAIPIHPLATAAGETRGRHRAIFACIDHRDRRQFRHAFEPSAATAAMAARASARARGASGPGTRP